MFETEVMAYHRVGGGNVFRMCLVWHSDLREVDPDRHVVVTAPGHQPMFANTDDLDRAIVDYATTRLCDYQRENEPAQCVASLVVGGDRAEVRQFECRPLVVR